MIEEFIAIIEKESECELISFLKTLKDDDKKRLTPQIKKLARVYGELGALGEGSTYGYINGTDIQRELIQYASFICFNRIDYERSPYSLWMLDKERLAKIVDWYCPSWLSDFVNAQFELDYVTDYIGYDWLMELSERGCLNPSKELLVKVMPSMIFEQRQNSKEGWCFKPENLLKRKITLEEHVWFLFEFQSNLHYCDRFLVFGERISKENIGWVFLFKEFAGKNLLDRSRLLKESLLASNRNFNKVLSGWFAQLFIELEPTKGDLLLMQDELFGVLGSSHSKPVNTSLQAIKKIISETSFKVDVFLDTVPVLLSSDTKSVVKSSLGILEKLPASHSGLEQRIALIVCQCFIQPDEELQLKAAAIIVKLGNKDQDDLRQELSVVQSSMLSSARQMLADFLDFGASSEQVAIDNEQIVRNTFWLDHLDEIPFPANWDDLVFMASQAFDNNESWHIDVLPAALVRYSTQLKPENVALLEPAFQRAFELIDRVFRSTNGYLDQLLAIFFIDFGNWLILNFPGQSERIRNIYRKYDQQEGEKQLSFLISPAAGSYTATWEAHNKITFYEPYKLLLLAALKKINHHDEIPLLATPTHAACWIAPNVLIDRLQIYQQAGVAPDKMDLQVALSRCFLPGSEKYLERAKKQLSGEFRELMIFLLSEQAASQKVIRDKAAWTVAFLAKNAQNGHFVAAFYNKRSLKNYSGQLQWQPIAETDRSEGISGAQKKNVEVPVTRRVLSVQRDWSVPPESGVKEPLSEMVSVSDDDPPMLYEFLNYRVSYLLNEHNDITRILSLIPNTPEPILADTINACLKYPQFLVEGQRKMVNKVVLFLYEIWNNPGEMSILFLGVCMLNVDKPITHTAAEIWIKGVTAGNINNSELGGVIGLLESMEFAPIKRFTDVVIQRLLGVSPLHNRELQILVEHILLRFPDDPIKNLKKLLEVYSELIALNNFSVNNVNLIERLQVWEQNTGLKKIAGTILPKLRSK